MTTAAPSAWGPDGDDTALARALHAGGVPLGALQRALAEVRAARRSGPGAGEALALATSLLASGAVTPEQLEAARSHLARTAVAASKGPGAASPSAFGPYRVVRELGRGGMGVVLEVVDAAGRRGALKTIVAGAEGELLARFRREARLHARLDHPHVAPVHAAELDQSPPYLVQAYLTGGTLAERLLERGPLPPDEVAALGRKLAAGLQHAHERGVLHRDLKPANILFDERGEPRIIDFGLARALDGASVRLTATGELLGTPSFIAPEVLTGAPVDCRTDVHGLAGLLFAALTGRPPHDGAGLFGTLNAALLHDPPRASTLRPDVPAWLDEALARGLAREPADRPATAAALGALLVEGAAAPRAGRRVGLGLAVVTGALALAWVAHGRGPVPTGDAAPDAAPRPTDPAAARAERRARVADLVAGRLPLPADPAALEALAVDLRASGVADLGSASATLVEFLAGQDETPASEVRRAVARLARDGPCPLTRAAAAALWSGALSARADEDLGAERALAAAAALAGPEPGVGAAVAAFWQLRADPLLPGRDFDMSTLVLEASTHEGPERDRLLRVAECVELAWRARPDAPPFAAGRLLVLHERLAQAVLRHYHSNRESTWPESLGALGVELRAVAPSDPLFRAMSSLAEPPDAAFASLLQVLRDVEGLPPAGEAAEFVRALVHNAVVALLVARCYDHGRWEDGAAWLRRSIEGGRCSSGAYDGLARALVTLAHGDPTRAPAFRAELEAYVARGPEEATRNLPAVIVELAR